MEVKVYSTPGCPWCQKAKEFLKANNIKYKDINVAEDSSAAKEMTEKSGQKGVPVIDIDGKILIGFDESELKGALGL
ncbi:MAG: glutathione S-transferase N-terminal domain-containing protein [Nanoarchaeota archaeon]|nr:glutathione S-transferase N-terminal domain-containing protein [Nanoarchaeota archaeon]